MKYMKFSQQRKMHVIIVALIVDYSDLAIACFPKVEWSFVVKVRKQLEATEGDSTNLVS